MTSSRIQNMKIHPGGDTKENEVTISSGLYIQDLIINTIYYRIYNEILHL